MCRKSLSESSPCITTSHREENDDDQSFLNQYYFGSKSEWWAEENNRQRPTKTTKPMVDGLLKKVLQIIFPLLEMNKTKHSSNRRARLALEMDRLEKVMINELEENDDRSSNSNNGLQEGTVLYGKNLQQSLIVYSNKHRSTHPFSWLGKIWRFLTGQGEQQQQRRRRREGPSSASAKWLGNLGRSVVAATWNINSPNSSGMHYVAKSA